MRFGSCGDGHKRGEDVVENALDMPFSRMKWGDVEIGQLGASIGSSCGECLSMTFSGTLG